MRASLPRQRLRIPTIIEGLHAPAPDLSQEASIALLERFIERGYNNSSGKGRTIVLTGAGASVDSGIRAYRGKNGSYTVNKKHRPIFYGEFIAEESFRRRYWARSYLGYPPVQRAEPNPTHYAVSALLKMGAVESLITQNVDGLHHKAWDTAESSSSAFLDAPLVPPPDPGVEAGKPPPILELHGTLRYAYCLSCQDAIPRADLQAELSERNPTWAKHLEQVDQGKEERLNPDGDVELGPGVRYEDFDVPPCKKCGGPIKPSVTFFGESLSPAAREISKSWVDSASQMLIVGSSLATFSAFSLVKRAKELGLEVGLLNVGDSRADGIVDWRLGWEGGSSDILPAAAARAFKKGVEEGGLGSGTGASTDEIEALLASGVRKPLAPGRAAS